MSPTNESSFRLTADPDYFMNANDRLRCWDKSMLLAADVEKHMIVQFYDQTIRHRLRSAEAVALAWVGQNASDIKQTIFRVRATELGFEYFVKDMVFQH